MPNYNVAVWVKYKDGGEGRHDTTVNAEDEDDAIEEAMGELPKGTKLKKKISVEESS